MEQRIKRRSTWGNEYLQQSLFVSIKCVKFNEKKNGKGG
jgi:hypothetical protein